LPLGRALWVFPGKAPVGSGCGLLPFSGGKKISVVIYYNMGAIMKKEEEFALKATKEIVVKFIEVGRLSVNSFEDVWNMVHNTVVASLKTDVIED
jgi:hypothetical protein